MKTLANTAGRFRQEEDGAAMIEYSILIGIIAVASIAVIAAIGTWVGNQFSGLCANLNGHGTDAAGTAGAGTCS